MPAQYPPDFERQEIVNHSSRNTNNKSRDTRLSSSGYSSADDVIFYIDEATRASSGDALSTDIAVFEVEINSNNVPNSDKSIDSNGNALCTGDTAAFVSNREQTYNDVKSMSECAKDTNLQPEICRKSERKDQDYSKTYECESAAAITIPTKPPEDVSPCTRTNANIGDNAACRVKTPVESSIEVASRVREETNNNDSYATSADNGYSREQQRFRMQQTRRHLTRRRTLSSAFESNLEPISSREDVSIDATVSDDLVGSIRDSGTKCKTKRNANNGKRTRSVSESDYCQLHRDECDFCEDQCPLERDFNSRTELLRKESKDSGVYSAYTPSKCASNVNKEISGKAGEQTTESSTEDVTFIRRYDTLVNDFQLLSSECSKLQESLKSQRKLFYSLLVVTVLLIVVTCVILVFTITIDKERSKYGVRGITEEDMESYVAEKLTSSKQACISCTSFRNLNTNYYATYTVKGDECCVDDVTTLIDHLTSLVIRGQTERDRRLGTLRVSMQNLLTAWNQSNSTAPTILVGSDVTERKHERGSIHLRGTVRGSKLSLLNQVTSTSLSLESEEIKVTYTANYFLYVKLSFVVPANTNSTIKYTIYQKNGRGNIHRLDDVVILADLEEQERYTESPFHRVVKLNQGDRVFISSRSDLQRKPVHMFGMFEI